MTVKCCCNFLLRGIVVARPETTADHAIMPIKTTTAKPRAAAKAGPKTDAKTGPARRVTKPEVVPEVAAVMDTAAVVGEQKVAGAGLRLKDLVDRVVAATGGKKKGVKEIVDAVLTQMGDALSRGEALHLPNFGKVRVAKTGAAGGGAMTLKLRRMTGTGKGKAAKAADGNDALADETDHG